jgi:hypothetical protein
LLAYCDAKSGLASLALSSHFAIILALVAIHRANISRFVNGAEPKSFACGKWHAGRVKILYADFYIFRYQDTART